MNTTFFERELARDGQGTLHCNSNQARRHLTSPSAVFLRTRLPASRTDTQASICHAQRGGRLVGRRSAQIRPRREVLKAMRAAEMAAWQDPTQRRLGDVEPGESPTQATAARGLRDLSRSPLVWLVIAGAGLAVLTSHWGVVQLTSRFSGLIEIVRQALG